MCDTKSKLLEASLVFYSPIKRAFATLIGAYCLIYEETISSRLSKRHCESELSMAIDSSNILPCLFNAQKSAYSANLVLILRP